MSYSRSSRSSDQRSVAIFFFALLAFVSGCMLWWSIWKGYEFQINCSGHLKRAADANTIELASQELVTAIRYCENNKLTKGSSSIIFDTPDTDIGFWYQNLKASEAELKKVDTNTSALERSNLLMKLRETLLDHGEKGDSVTAPPNIAYHPNYGTACFGWLGGTGIFLCVMIICIILKAD